MIARNQTKPDGDGSGCTHPLHAEVRSPLLELAARGLDQSAVAFHVGVEHSTVHRWWHGKTKDLAHAATVLRLFSALLRVCPDAAMAARVHSEESWSALLAGLRQTHEASWVGRGFRDILDGADDAPSSRRRGAP